jgi:hypothetical protein
VKEEEVDELSSSQESTVSEDMTGADLLQLKEAVEGGALMLRKVASIFTKVERRLSELGAGQSRSGSGATKRKKARN